MVGKLLAQERIVRGLVFDRDSKVRLTRVFIVNSRTQIGFYNTTKGEFKTTAQTGDVLFFLKRNSIRLKEVLIKDTLQNPVKKVLETREDFKDIYRKGNVSDIFTTGGGNGMGGAGLSIDALYNAVSREGKNARFLQKIIDRDYKEAVIDYRYTPALVQQATGLTGLKLKDFMQHYRPTYNLVLVANDYEMIRFIQGAYQRYLINPGAYRLPPLK